MSKLIGIDYGSKRVGIAITDDGASVAFPKTALPNNAKLAESIVSLMGEEGADTAVIGESRNMRGEENAVFAGAKALGEALKEKGVLVVYEPEFYSSVEARHTAGGGPVDAQAAAIILNSYISRTQS